MSARGLLELYKHIGPVMFDKAFILYRVRNLYDSKPLAQELQKRFGEKTNLSVGQRLAQEVRLEHFGSFLGN